MANRAQAWCLGPQPGKERKMAKDTDSIRELLNELGVLKTNHRKEKGGKVAYTREWRMQDLPRASVKALLVRGLHTAAANAWSGGKPEQQQSVNDAHSALMNGTWGARGTAGIDPNELQRATIWAAQNRLDWQELLKSKRKLILEYQKAVED